MVTCSLGIDFFGSGIRQNSLRLGNSGEFPLRTLFEIQKIVRAEKNLAHVGKYLLRGVGVFGELIGVSVQVFQLLRRKGDGHVYFVIGWLAFKVASKWQVWSTVVKVPDSIKGVGEPELLTARRKWGANLLMRFWIGTLGNLLVGIGCGYIGRLIFAN